MSDLRNTSSTFGQRRLRSSCGVVLGQAPVGVVELKTGWGLGHDPIAGLSFVVVAFEISGAPSIRLSRRLVSVWAVPRRSLTSRFFL